MKEQDKTPEVELNETDRANLSEAEFKTLVIRMLRELHKHSKKIKEQMVTLNKIKISPQETNREGKEAGIQMNNLEHKKEINIQPEQKEETRIQKNEGRLRNC